MSTNNSIWPVILVPYNLPPWLCMKQPSSILSMIIPGPRMVGNNIDVYLQPLIKELNEFWSEGIQTFDSSKNEMFRMRAGLDNVPPGIPRDQWILMLIIVIKKKHRYIYLIVLSSMCSHIITF